jgi:hypothetical protein
MTCRTALSFGKRERVEREQNKERGAACFCCLGKRQGCAREVCTKFAEVPMELICEECALSNSGNPNNVLVCAISSHRKPTSQSIINALEKWIPNLSVTDLAACLSVNSWAQPEKHRTAVQAREAAARQQKTTTKAEEAATAVADTGGTMFSGYSARATFPCCRQSEAHPDTGLHAAYKSISRRLDPVPV